MLPKIVINLIRMVRKNACGISIMMSLYGQKIKIFGFYIACKCYVNTDVSTTYLIYWPGKKSSMMLGFYPKSDQTFLNDFVPVCITGCPNQWSNSQSFQKMRPLCSMMFLGGI